MSVQQPLDKPISPETGYGEAGDQAPTERRWRPSWGQKCRRNMRATSAILFAAVALAQAPPAFDFADVHMSPHISVHSITSVLAKRSKELEEPALDCRGYGFPTV
jgi:hypothetical protein